MAAPQGGYEPAKSDAGLIISASFGPKSHQLTAQSLSSKGSFHLVKECILRTDIDGTPIQIALWGKCARLPTFPNDRRTPDRAKGRQTRAIKPPKIVPAACCASRQGNSHALRSRFDEVRVGPAGAVLSALGLLSRLHVMTV